jgi:hypothetical protein
MAQFSPGRFAPGMGALTSTDGAHPRERPSGGVGAGRGWNRVLDRATPVASTLRSLHAVSHSLRSRTPAHLRNVAVRPVRRRRNGRRASPLPGGDATAVVKLRHHPRPTESGPAFRLGLTDWRFREVASALEVHSRMLAWSKMARLEALRCCPRLAAGATLRTPIAPDVHDSLGRPGTFARECPWRRIT